MQNDNSTQKENLKICSTPKFRKFQTEKENTSKNNSLLGFEISNFEEPKNNNSKNLQDSNNIDNKDSKDENFFKENFSLSSLLNNCNNKTPNKNNIDINKENNSNIISFCDKIENNSFNNEIIYKEKDINSSTITNKDKEEMNLKNNSIDNDKENIPLKIEENEIKIGGNLNINMNSNKYENSIEIKTNGTNGIRQNDSSSFQYNLPLDNDKVPTIKGFFEFDKIETYNTLENINKSLDYEKVNQNIINIKDNNFTSKKSIITYSKKKAKRNNTEKTNKTYKVLPIMPTEENASNEMRKNKSLIERGINKITIKRNILHSYGNYNKINNKIKKAVINISNKDNKEPNEILFTEGTNYNTISPKKRLKIIIKKTKINKNLNINKQDNDLSSLETFNKKNFHHKNEIIDLINKNINSLTTNNKKYKTRKLIKSSFDFYNTIHNFKINDSNKNNKNMIGNFLKEKNNFYKGFNDSSYITQKGNKNNNLTLYKKLNKQTTNKKEYNNRSRNYSNLYSNKKN